MNNRLGIEMLTLMGMPPVEHAELAARLGCVSISTGLKRLPLSMFGRNDLWPDWSLSDNLALQRALRAALKANGIHIGLGEGFRVAPGMDVSQYEASLDLFAELGTRRINAISTEPDQRRAVDQFNQLVDMVRERGMRCLIEFAPPNAINDADSARSMVETLGSDRCAMMLDAMHFFRSGGDLSMIPDLPIAYAQLCDAPVEQPANVEYMEEAMFHRHIPNAGELPLEALVAALPADCPISLEVPNAAALASTERVLQHAAACVAAARRLGA